MANITATTAAPVSTTTTDTNTNNQKTETFTARTLMRGYSIPMNSPSSNDTKSWYEAMAKAWGQALNRQAQVITDLSSEINEAGNDQPSQITQLTAESMRFSYIATNASTATTSVGEALQTLGRKQ